MPGTIGDIAQLNIILTNTVSSDRFENVLHFERLDTAQSFADLADEFDLTCLTDWLNPSTDLITCSLLSVRDVVPGTGAGADKVVSPAKDGGWNVTETLPFQDAGVISWRTASAGRSYRGRSYMVGIPEAHQQAGTLDSALVTSLTTAAQSVLDQYGPGGVSTHWQVGIVSRFAAGVARTPPIITPITSFIPRAAIRTQRRRQLGVGG